jgi:hypothetical protein
MGMGSAGFGNPWHVASRWSQSPVVSGRCPSMDRGDVVGLVDRGIATGQMDRDHTFGCGSGDVLVATPGKNLWLLIRITALEWWTTLTGSTAWVDQVSDIGVGDRVIVDELAGTVLAINSVKSQYFVQFANGTTGWYDAASVTLEYPRR